MTSVQSSSPEDEFESAKKQIRGLVGEIAQLGKSDLQPEEFYAAFLQRVVQALAATGGAVWILGEGKRPQLSYQINMSPTLLDPESEDATRHAKLLDVVLNTNQPQLIPPLSGNEHGGNPTRNLLVIAPLGHDKQVEGLVEVFQRPNTQPNTQKGYLKFLLQMTELASEWFKNRRLRQFSDRHSLWAQADSFARMVHDSLDFKETSYTIVNEGRKMIGCDRVSVAVNRGGVCKVEAISGQDTMDNRSNVVYHLGQLATRVVASGETLWYNGNTDNMPPQIEQALESYVDESYTKSMVILPLRKPKAGDESLLNPDHEELQKREIIGALIVEQLESDVPREVLDPRIDLVYEHTARALANTLDHHSLFMMPVWKAIGKSKVIVQGRNLPKTILITGIVLACLLASLLIPVPFNLKSKGALQPTERQVVYAGTSGEVDVVNCDDGSQVKTDDVLLTLKNPELLLEIEKLTGERQTTQKELDTVLIEVLNDTNSGPDKEQKRARLGELSVALDTLNTQLSIKEIQKKRLDILSPRTGQVITWDAKEKLERRPVQEGDELLTVADLNGPWHVELFMPERRIGKLKSRYNQAAGKEKVPVRFILMTDPHNAIEGWVKEIEESTFVHEEEGPCVRVKVELKDKPSDKSRRPNAALTASVTVGTCSLAYYYLHEAWEYLQANWFFF
jgi:HlyD family secretion protein